MQVLPFNMDGREFVRMLLGHKSREEVEALVAAGVAPGGLGLEPGVGTTFEHVVMNLPASAVEFLDVFKVRPTSNPHRLALVPVLEPLSRPSHAICRGLSPERRGRAANCLWSTATRSRGDPRRRAWLRQGQQLSSIWAARWARMQQSGW